MSINEIPIWAADAAAAILQTVLKKDPFTFHHCCRVGLAARQLGKAMNLPEFELAILEYSGLFHDIGKIGLSDSILLKPGRLDENEHAIMKNHAEMSIQIIRPLTKHAFFRFLVPGIRYHHERFDGKGYPIGLMGEKIPLIARAVAVVDSVDAMMNTRPYRQALNWDYVQKELIDYSGTQFDPNLVRIYLDAAKNGFFEKEALKDDVVIQHILRAA
ncbi:MAG: HD domain-containing protein [Bdellovibrionales bacterium]|nr:HD domain-containing protein [Bdellovibrionales bacterium]